ncbi:MAG: hypothetical protein WD578_04200 [Bacteroidales bacterium]
MTDYKELLKICEQNSRISERVVDDFLLDYTARYQGLEKKMNTQFGWYREVTSKFKKEDVARMKSQFIIHRVFREDGLIHKLMKNPALQRFKGEEKDFLQQQATVPWRFSFAEILEEPEKAFFRMRDVFREEEYLLFSPGIAAQHTSGNTLLWLNLIGFNGSCWQSFGPIGAFQSFDADDVLFFAMEHNHAIEEGMDVPADIEKYPLPYMLLLSGAAYPRTFHKEDEMVYHLVEYDLDSLDTAGLKKSFISEYDNGVYRLTDKEYGEYPHFAQVYFDERKRLLLLTAMTGRGFRGLVRNFNTHGFDFSEYSSFTVRPQLITTAQAILKRKIVVNEYFERFEETPDPETSDTVAKLNALMNLVMPEINAGRKPDIDAAAKKVGLDAKTAHEALDQVLAKFEQMPGGIGRAGEGPLQAPDKKKGIGGRSAGKLQPGAGKKETPGEKSGENLHPGSGAGASPETFRKIYAAAREIRKMEPWKALFEVDLFGIQIPGTDRVYFISVMGHNGEFTAISAYRGYEGLAGFYELQQNGEKLPPETILTIPHLMLSFQDREDLEKADLDAIGQSGGTFSGKGNWPKLDETIPGLLPAYPEGETLQDLPVLLEQVTEVLSVAVKDPNFLYSEDDDDNEADEIDDVFMRRPVVSKGKVRWENSFEDLYERIEPVHFKVTFDRDLCAAVSRRKVSKAILQADLFMLPAPVKEKGRKGYFPFVLLLVDKQSGMVKGMSMLTPEPDLHTMYERVGQKLMEEMNKAPDRPERVELHSELLLALTEDALKQSWCMPVLQEDMPLVDEARESLIAHLS